MPTRPVTRRGPAPARRLAVALAAGAVLVPVAACGADEPTADAGASLRSAPIGESAPAGTDASSSAVSSAAVSASADVTAARATLEGPDGTPVGTVTFTAVEGGTAVAVEVEDGGEPGAFHGLHVHANDDPANGEGCVADPAAPPADWFVSADGHLASPPGGEAPAAAATHGDHAGDLPPLLVLADGTARAETTTDRFTVADVAGAAVVLHAAADNTGHVPAGTAEDQYTPNALAALDLTQRTGNAGPRIACGVVTPS